MNTISVVLAAIALGVMTTLRVGSLAWQRLVERLLEQIRSDTVRRATPIGRFFTEQIAQLPAPVQRYFGFALSPGQPLVVAAHTTSCGEFRMRPQGDWHTFTATQHFCATPPSFVWDARINVSPVLDVNVADGYLRGEGAMSARVAGVIPVPNHSSKEELAAGELLRYLAEAVMLPTALLPSSGVRWSPVDDSSAQATLTDRGTTVSAIFHFGPQGEIMRVSAQRFRDVRGKAVLTPWVGQFRDYRSIQGMMVPMVGEVAWILGGGVMSYFRGRTTNITYELAA